MIHHSTPLNAADTKIPISMPQCHGLKPVSVFSLIESEKRIKAKPVLNHAIGHYNWYCQTRDVKRRRMAFRLSKSSQPFGLQKQKSKKSLFGTWHVPRAKHANGHPHESDVPMGSSNPESFSPPAFFVWAAAVAKGFLQRSGKWHVAHDRWHRPTLFWHGRRPEGPAHRMRPRRLRSVQHFSLQTQKCKCGNCAPLSLSPPTTLAPPPRCGESRGEY